MVKKTAKKQITINGSFRWADLAVALTAYREKEKLTYRDFQEKYGIDKGNLQAIEKSGRKTGLENIILLCNILGVPVQSFITPKAKKTCAKQK